MDAATLFPREIDLGWGMPEKSAALFPLWYAENREYLRWAKEPDGNAGFALKTGHVRDAAYFQTMEKYLAKARALEAQQ